MLEKEEHTEPSGTIVMGMGNILKSDDGVGIHVARILAAISLPPFVTVLDAGTAVMDQLPHLLKAERLICIDAVETGDRPGSIFRFSPGDVHYRPGYHTSSHQLSLFDVLKMTSSLTGRDLPVTIVGIQPKCLDFGIGLSRECKRVIDRAVCLVLYEIGEGRNEKDKR
jgi:hydrogenase maturation protease